MKKLFLKNLVFVIIINLIIKPFWIFFIDRTVNNVTGSEEYGKYFSLYSFTFIFSIILDLGINSFSNRIIAQNNHLLNKYFGIIFPVKLALSVFYVLLSVIVAYCLNFSNREMNLLYFMLLNQIFISFISYFRASISGLLYLALDSILSVLDKFLLIIVCGYFLYFLSDFNFTIEYFVYIQTGVYLITFLISFYILKQKTKLHFNIHLKLKYWYVILKQCFPYALLALQMALYFRMDAVLLHRLLPQGNEQAGVYAQSFRLFDAVSMFAILFAGILLPLFAKLIKEKQNCSFLIQQAVILLFIPIVALIIISLFYGKEILYLLYPNNLAPNSLAVFHFVMLGLLGISLTYIFGTLLTSGGKLKILNKIALTGVLFNFLINIILIPNYQASGAAFTSMCTQILTGSVQVYFAVKLFRLNFSKHFLLRFVGIIIVSIILGMIFKYFNLQWIIASIVIAISLALLSFLFRIVSLAAVTDALLKKKE